MSRNAINQPPAEHSSNKGKRRTRKDRAVDFASISQALLVADHASFSRVAQILGVRQSAVSRRIRALEDELGVSLFERQSNGVQPTTAGRRFFDRTRAAFTEINYAIKNAAAAGRGVDGMIRIGVESSECADFLFDLLRAYREDNPDVVFEYCDWPSRKLISGIMERRIDVAIIVGGAPAPGCDVEPLWSAAIYVALSATHPLSGCDAIEWELLKEEQFIFGREAIAAGLDDYASEKIAKIGGRVSLATHDLPEGLVMRLVSRGFGLSLVCSSTAGHFDAGVAFRPITGEEKRVSYCAVWLPGNDNPALRRFLSLARSMSRQRFPPKVEKVLE